MTLQTSMSFHNTTGLSGSELEVRTEKAKSQDEDVLELFNGNYSVTMTPETALNTLKAAHPERYKNTPLTSIRRAFSNLKNKGLIRKLDNVKVAGNFGMKVNTWKLV
jgi:hypothetical protein